jgi:hypothetical protein
MYPAGCLPCCHICNKGELGFSPVSLYALPWLVEAQTEFLCAPVDLYPAHRTKKRSWHLHSPMGALFGNHGRLRSIKISYSSP